MAKRSRSNQPKVPAATRSKSPTYPGEPELIFIARAADDAAVAADGAQAFATARSTAIARVLPAGAIIRPLFGVTEHRLIAERTMMADMTGAPVPDLSVYYKVDAPAERLAEIHAQLVKLDEVEAAYIKPPAEPAERLNDMAPAAEMPPAATPDYTLRQGYLDAAPGGIDARYAWTLAGGRGLGVRIIDIEGAWRFSHEDLLQNQGGVVGGTPSADLGWRNHGTAVVGEIGGDLNTLGITGICSDANVRAISIFGNTGSAAAIRMAANMLGAGDIILIELHRPGPRFNFAVRPDQRGYIAVEWWPDDYDAVRFATSRGVIVVAAAGNGAENLDDPIYAIRPPGFPATWSNPFARGSRDSGAIIAGAGAPPPGTHGANHGPDRSRLDFSNYGACVDAQGWGREVTTAGYGDLQGGLNEDLWYTDRFSGTSSASPIVVGALGAAQGIFRSRGTALLTPATARQRLRATGSAQQAAPGRPATQRIGNRPNLRQLVGRIKSAIKPEIKEIKEHKLEKREIKEHLKIEVKEGKAELKEHLKGEVKEIKEHKPEVEGKLQREKVTDRIELGGGSSLGDETFDGGAELMQMILQRLDAIEGQLATQGTFIAPDERPDVGVR